MSAVLTAPTSVMAGGTANIAFSTQTGPTPVITDSTAPQPTGVEFSGVASVTGGSSPTVTLSSSGTLSTTVTGLPATTPTNASLTLPKQGVAAIVAPASVQILPTDTAGTKFAAITCTAVTSATARSISITVTSATTTAPTPSAPAYSCKVYVNGKYEVTLPPAPLDESVRVDGKLTTGSTDTVTWTSPPTQNGLGGPYKAPGFTVTRVTFQGSLPVTGAQQGSVSLYRSTADTAITTLKVTGSLFLSQPGTIDVHLLKTFRWTVNVKFPNGATETSTEACSTKAAPVARTLKVTGNPVQPPSTNGSATPVPTGTATGAPVGAPNTGGGRPASNLPLVAGGAALLAVGAGLAFTARRRRHSEN